MNRTDRLLGIVLELQRRRWVRAEDLAAKFETSKRTIYRDMQALGETGVPLLAEAGRGYSLVEGYFLPPLSFTADEATMLLLGGDFIARHFDAQYRAAANTAIAKLEAVLAEKLRAETDYLRKNICFVTPETLGRAHSAELLALLRRAIIERRTVRFRYHTRSARDKATAQKTREVDPYGLLHYDEAWYLIGYCHLRRDFRNFRLERMSELALLEGVFARRPDFVMEQPPDDQPRIVARVWFDEEAAPWVREGRSYAVEKIEDCADGVLVTYRVYNIVETLPWILRWGGHARVLEPDALRERVAEEARRMLENNSAQPNAADITLSQAAGKLSG
jgi:predicted DNA-binding transcriptional regulator YafY